LRRGLDEKLQAEKIQDFFAGAAVGAAEGAAGVAGAAELAAGLAGEAAATAVAGT
jgi:hypothetical protein